MLFYIKTDNTARDLGVDVEDALEPTEQFLASEFAPAFFAAATAANHESNDVGVPLFICGSGSMA